MKSTEYIDLALKKENMTRYKLAKKTGISDSSLSSYKSGRRIMDDYACFKIAEILCIDPKKIIIRANAEREKDEEKKEFWKEKMKEMGFITMRINLVIIAIITTITIAILMAKQGFTGMEILNTVYYVK